MQPWTCLALIAALCGSNANAQAYKPPALDTSAGAIEGMDRSTQVLLAWIADANLRKTAPPTLRNAVAARFLRAALNPEVLADVKMTDVEAVSARCADGGKLMQAYQFFGLPSPSGPAGLDIAALERAEKNMKRFEAETSLASAFAIGCTAELSKRGAVFMSGLPLKEWNDARRAGLAQMRRGALNVIQGNLTVLSTPGISPANRQVLITALVKYVPTLFDFMDQPTRTSIVALVADAPAETDAEQRQFDELRSVLAHVRCTAACLMPPKKS